MGHGGVPGEAGPLNDGVVSFRELIRSRRMTRDFKPDALPAGLLDDLLDSARRVPSAGNSQGYEFLVLDTPAAVSRYWDVTLPEPARGKFGFPGLLRAPVLVVVYADPHAYLERYSEADKAATGLGVGTAAWSTPYWLVDASFAALALQLAAIDAGLGVLFFGLFRRAPAVAGAFGVPEHMEAVGTVAIGHRAGEAEGRSRGRARRPLTEVVHRGAW